LGTSFCQKQFSNHWNPKNKWKINQFQRVTENVGPTVMSGRVVDVDVNPEEIQPNFLCGICWADFGTNNGMSFRRLWMQRHLHKMWVICAI
jgi:hypothetical protein